MAQHIPIEQFSQKAIKTIERSIRNQRYFRTSMKFEQLPSEYSENEGDQVFVTHRAVPKSICQFKPTFEVHTKPNPRGGRIATNIYLVA